MGKIYDDNSETIGKTPLIKINHIVSNNSTKIFAKVESRNPAFSVKCRIGSSMIKDAETQGILHKGVTLVEPTSGNTGIALAFIAAARGYELILTMPETMSLERRMILKALGAKLVLTEGAKGMNGALARAKEIVAEDHGRKLMLQQFENPANPRIHETTTGPEIWDDTAGAIDVLISGVGTGGTITGISRYIKHAKKKNIISIAVEPSDSPVISQTLAGGEIKPGPHKIQGIGAGFIPVNLDLSIIDLVETVSNEKASQYAHLLMQKEGILAGISSGAAMAVAVRIAEREEFFGKNIVVILPDSGERYLSSFLFAGFFSELELEQ